MKHRQLVEDGGLRTFVLVFDAGDEVCRELLRFVDVESITAASMTGIGAFSGATLGYFDPERRDYAEIPVDEQVEALSLIGDVALAPDGGPQLHVHVVLGRRDGAALGGHLLAAKARPTLEVVLTETPATLRRRTDPDTGLALIAP